MERDTLSAPVNESSVLFKIWMPAEQTSHSPAVHCSFPALRSLLFVTAG